jgi:hypothetical protein
MNIPFLQLTMMASYINFLEPEKVQSILQTVSAMLLRRSKDNGLAEELPG